MGGYGTTPVSAPLGSISDQVWRDQEELGEASDFVIPVHEFQRQSNRLNTDGEDHIKRLAERILSSDLPMQVIVERTMFGRQVGQFRYPVQPDPELDDQRREIVVKALQRLGVVEADDIVVVAPHFAAGANGQDAEAAYYQTLVNGGNGSGFGGGFGGFGGGGVFGGSFSSQSPGGDSTNAGSLGAGSSSGTQPGGGTSGNPTGP